MICFPNAKINLGLNIVSRREDGYHNLETVFYPIPLCDALEVVSASGDRTTFTQTGIPVDGLPEDNLVMKAYSLFCQEAGQDYKLDLYLRKHIPFGAGLGGGSADASFLLKLMNEYTDRGFTDDQLEAMASRLGADCPFFIRNTPVYAEGTGNVFSPVAVSLKGYRLVLIKPDIHISTREAFSLIRPRRPERSVKEIVQTPVAEWKDSLRNDFEESVFPQYPEIGAIKQDLYDRGAIYASMSGSGSSVFGLFDASFDGDLPDKAYQMKPEL
ncbi:4-(cytidine 5'-diphospho)-2-C-methyl-D-erythritol kinase [Bacteroidales bacterium OttesenSCG-928-J19]|nr:4-(cytidine 5'-diphospho)-2-C-methyl-D-erythritol kinase [Bacteroidales bacterium OttesenSCG-928-J19]